MPQCARSVGTWWIVDSASGVPWVWRAAAEAEAMSCEARRGWPGGAREENRLGHSVLKQAAASKSL